MQILRSRWENKRRLYSMDNVIPKVAILMSTYNGEKYLREQLDSIICQKNVEVYLFIRDDGSTDETVPLLTKYELETKNFFFINKESNKNVGIRESYFRLIKHVNALFPEIRFYAFADQDDVWLDSKIDAGVKNISESKNPRGALYYSNKVFVNSKLEVIKNENIKYYDDYMEILWPSLASGCTMIFNKELINFALTHEPKIDCLHDAWIYRLAKSIGSDIVFDKDAHILYRQHEKNVCGMQTTNLYHSKSYMINHFLSNLFSERSHVIQNFANELYDSYATVMSDEALGYITDVLDYNKNPSHKVALLTKADLRKRGYKERIVWMYKVIFNML